MMSSSTGCRRGSTSMKIGITPANLRPGSDSIIADPMTRDLGEPYCVLALGDVDETGRRTPLAITRGLPVPVLPGRPSKVFVVVRSYLPGHADPRWVPTRVATTREEVRVAF